jgi:hypothetical protein
MQCSCQLKLLSLEFLITPTGAIDGCGAMQIKGLSLRKLQSPMCSPGQTTVTKNSPYTSQDRRNPGYRSTKGFRAHAGETEWLSHGTAVSLPQCLGA